MRVVRALEAEADLAGEQLDSISIWTALYETFEEIDDARPVRAMSLN
jgi:hypothetical protein